MKRFLLWMVAISVSAPAQQLAYNPQPIAAFVSSDGTGAVGTWNPLTGSGGTSPLTYVPPAYGMYYSSDGTGAAGTWVPWNGSGGGGGGGVESINGELGAFTFTGSGVNCVTTTCTFSGGSSGISGLTTGQVAVAGSATTITSSKPLAGTGAGITTGPVSGVTAGDLAVFTGTAGQLTDGAITGSSVVTLTGTQALTNKTVDGVTPATFVFVDPTSSIQTQLNSKGNTTSTSLTTNTLPKANGANSIINSVLTDDGTTLTYSGSGGAGASSVSAGQFIATGATPTIANGAAAGTLPGTPTITGANAAGVITVTTGTVTTASATLATITFNGTLATAPRVCLLQAQGVNAAGQNSMIYSTAPTTTGWTIAVAGSAIPVSTTYTWGYVCT